MYAVASQALRDPFARQIAHVMDTEFAAPTVLVSVIGAGEPNLEADVSGTVTAATAWGLASVPVKLRVCTAFA